MKHTTKPIPLHPVTVKAEESVVKRSALSTFRLVRAAVAQARTVPAFVAQAASDVRQAWGESASPKS